MGRRKLEMKRIKDKNSRQVTFSKRRSGLNKKTRHLSVRCDVDVAVVIFSSLGKLYEYCSGNEVSVQEIASIWATNIAARDPKARCYCIIVIAHMLRPKAATTNALIIDDDVAFISVELILSRYQKSILETEEEEEEEERSTQEKASQDYMEGTNYPCTRFRTCKELLESVRRVDEEGNKVSVSDMTELEEELSAALMHTRSRKTQLMMKRISSLHEQEKKLTEEKEEMKQQVASAAKQKGYLDDGASSHCYKTNSSQLLITLPLFNFKDLD